MKRFIVVFFVFLFALTGISFSSLDITGSSAPVKSAAETSYTLEEEFIYVRVLIDGHWWTYVYASDGSFIVAIPDDDE